MRQDNLYINEEARGALISGIRKVARAVGSTMGTGGSNAIIEAIENPGHLMTNDGWTIANSIVLADPMEEMGRKILVEAINRANKASGDGSSTTCVLTAATLEEGMKHLNEGSLMTLKKSLEDCLPIIEKSIKKQTRSLFVDGALDLNMLERVATVSSEDEQIGKRISEIYKEIGKTGIIHWDISKTAEDTHTIGSGITVEGAGWYSPYMCDATESGQNTNQIRIKNPHILLTKQKIASAADFNTIAAALNGKEIKDMVVFCDEIEPLVIPDIIRTRAIRGFRIAIVKMPVLWKDWWFEDLAKATGAKVADPIAGLPLKDIAIEHLGSCKNIVITKEDSYIDGIADVSFHISVLNALGTEEGKLRAARLNTKTARYFVGALSDSALSHRRLKVEDAISASYQALNGGIVPGGGIALLNVALALDSGKTTPTVGQRILMLALMAPFDTILSNAGLQGEVVDGELYTDGGTKGYDTRTGKLVDMFEAGIVDPANIVLNAARNAVSVAAAILTANTVVTLPRQEQLHFDSLPNGQLVSQ